MEYPDIYITHHGEWEENEYKKGVTDMMLLRGNINYSSFLDKVYKLSGFDSSKFKLDLSVKLKKNDDRSVRFKIEDDVDLQNVLSRTNGFEVFVTDSPRLYGGFVELMESQLHPESQYYSQTQFPQATPTAFQVPIGYQFPPATTTTEANVEYSSTFPPAPNMLSRSIYSASVDRSPSIDLNTIYSASVDRRPSIDLNRPSKEVDNNWQSYEDYNDDDDEDDEDDEDYNEDDIDDDDNNYNKDDVDGGKVKPNVKDVRRRWEIPGSSNYNIVEVQTVLPTNEQLIHVGAMFGSKEELKLVLGKFALEGKFNYRIRRSCQKRFNVSCTVSDCSFELRAVGIISGSSWRVTKWVDSHTCQLSLSLDRHQQISTAVITSLIAPKLADNGRNIRPKDVIGDMRADHGVEILYSTAWRATERARNMVYGNALQSFHRLPKFLYMLEKANPRTVTKLKLDSENRFRYCFIALGASISGWEYCRNVIVVDGAHLKGTYKGTMFVAATKDANDQIFPLAFGIGDVENDSTWIWFMTQLRNILGAPRDLVIVSDDHGSIANAVSECFPFASHCLCTYHLSKHVKKYKNATVSQLFEKAARTYFKKEADNAMAEIKVIKVKAYNYLMDKGIKRWSRAYCPFRRYDSMTSNIAESLNNVFKEARKLPICTLIEIIRDTLQRWFYDRRNTAAKSDTFLSDWADQIITKNLQKSGYLQVKPIDSVRYNITRGSRSRIVNIALRKCTCKRFNFEKFPCIHGCAAIR